MAVMLAVIPAAVSVPLSFQVNANDGQVNVEETSEKAPKTTRIKVATDLNATAKQHKIHLNETATPNAELIRQKQAITITPGENAYNEARHQLEAEAAAKAKAKAEAAAKAAAEAKAKAAADAAAKAKAANAAKASAQQSTPASNNAPQVSGKNYGTFKLSFYDPAVLGSSMGYGGVAADLSLFPKGTRLKITLSSGEVWYRTVNDTGTFVYSNSRQLDVAWPNDQIPSAGILSATVEVV